VTQLRAVEPVETSRALLIAIAASVAVVLSGPFVGDLNTFVGESLPGQYLLITAAAILAPAVIGLALAIRRIRERRLLRYGALVLAMAVAVVYVTVTQPLYTERFHLTEYAVVTFLFYRVWRSRGDATTLVLPVVAGLLAALADEWFQWFIPTRVGELHDVVLNSVGISAGLLSGLGLDPPERLRRLADDRARHGLAVAALLLIAATAVFLQCVHLGFEIVDSEIGTFRSRYDASTLHQLAAKHAGRWPTLSAARISREDHYVSEARFHVQERNRLFGAGDLRGAWKENRILERFYGPVIDVIMHTDRWPAEQRTHVAAAAAGDERPYVSRAYPLPIYAWNRGWFWGTVAVLLAAAGASAAQRTPRAPQSASV
jgi:hypothetical protein